MTSSHTSLNNHSKKSHTHLNQLGWSSFFQKQLKDTDLETSPARVIGVRKNSFLISQGDNQLLVTLAGSLLKEPGGRFPAVGDWVLVRDSIIFSILLRKNELIRKTPGGKHRKNNEPSQQDQIIAVNVDKVFIVCGLDRDYNLRRIERYLTMVYNCSMTPEIVLTKADLHHNPSSFVNEVESIAFGVPIHLISAEDESIITDLQSNLTHGKTVVLIGSSGAGKSTLINRLYGKEILATGSLSESLGKGKHTTTNRDLVVLPTGGMVIDNPGIREIALGVGSPDSLSAFPEIDDLSLLCKFQDCNHTHEPGCQVIAAVTSGTLAPDRLQSYHKIQNELKYSSDRQLKSASQVERERWKGVSKKIKAINKRK